MIDYINEREPLHILTVEDPIEFVFTDKKAYINQREIGLDSKDWHKALKDAVRQDPDVILVGELRDVETFEAAVHAAETGHLVFGTIHASSSGTTINRILDLFPPEKHGAIRQALANNLKAVVAQKLVKGLKKGRVPTNEIMIVNPTIRNLIRKGEDNKIPDAIRIGYLEGMVDFNENLRQLVERGDIDKRRRWNSLPTPTSSRWPSRASRWRLRVFSRGGPGCPRLASPSNWFSGFWVISAGLPPAPGPSAMPVKSMWNRLSPPCCWSARGLAGMAFLWLVPWFWLGWLICVAMIGAAVFLYIHYRNQQVDACERLLTAEHCRESSKPLSPSGTRRSEEMEDSKPPPAGTFLGPRLRSRAQSTKMNRGGCESCKNRRAIKGPWNWCKKRLKNAPRIFI